MLHGQPTSAVAAKFGLNLWTARAHRKKCLPWRNPQVPKEEGIAAQMAELKRELWRLQLLAEAGENVSGALQVVRQRQSLLELEARTAGLLDATHKKLILNNRPPSGDFEVVFSGGRPKTVEVGEK
ncbi:MAG: hypothetical protein WBL56_17585 [Candidatus Acidiferrum sp.]